MTDPLMTPEAVQKQLRETEFDFEKLMEPYREGGTTDHRIKRTWGTMISWLLDKLKYPSEVIGAAILLVCLEMKNGKEFKGDGTYGSKGNELAQYIKNTCLVIQQRNESDMVFNLMGKKAFGAVEKRVADNIRKNMAPWYKNIWAWILTGIGISLLVVMKWHFILGLIR